MAKVKRVEWTIEAQIALKQIYDFHANISIEFADKKVAHIIKTGDSIVFTKQYQTDEINPKYRRIRANDYKLLYKEHDDIVFIMDIVSLKDNPKNQNTK